MKNVHFKKITVNIQSGPSMMSWVDPHPFNWVNPHPFNWVDTHPFDLRLWINSGHHWRSGLYNNGLRYPFMLHIIGFFYKPIYGQCLKNLLMIKIAVIECRLLKKMTIQPTIFFVNLRHKCILSNSFSSLLSSPLLQYP